VSLRTKQNHARLSHHSAAANVGNLERHLFQRMTEMFFRVRSLNEFFGRVLGAAFRLAIG
jgi:hypothetical protein